MSLPAAAGAPLPDQPVPDQPVPDQPVPDQRVARTVVTAIREILPDVSASQITAGQSLAGLGADSVDRVEILSLITERLGRRDPLSNFADLPDIGVLINYLSGGDAT